VEIQFLGMPVTPVEECPINQLLVIRSKPRARVHNVLNTRKFQTGYWDCTKGRFMWHYDADELIQIVKGSAHITRCGINSKAYTVTEGHSVFFPKGSIADWIVDDYVEKVKEHAVNEVAVSQSFQDRLFEKIKTDMGSLMTDTEMKSLVVTSIERIFFTGKERKQNNYPYETIREEPEIYKIVKAAVEKQIEQQVKNYIGEHADLYKKTIEDTLAKGFASLAIRAIQDIINVPIQVSMGQLHGALMTMVTKLQEKGINLS
jgi:uncharacterized cupin superfamily protein